MAVYQYHLLILLYFYLTTLLIIPTNSHNITAILDAFPDYSVYNTYLSRTKVSNEINSHKTVTCLVLSNSVMSSLVAKQSLTLTGIKNMLRLLSLIGYFDHQNLHNLTRGTTLTTTLYQTTGVNAPSNLSFVKITNLRGGRFGFASSRPRWAFDATYTKSVKQIPYNLSVLEISAPITFPRLMDASSAPHNLTALLEKAGCKIFASLITASGMLKIYESAMDKGFTLFAAKDVAFKADGAPDLTTLSRTDLVTILLYHALPSYTPKASLKTARGAIATMASNSSGKYKLSVICHGDDQVSLSTGVSTARVASTVLDDTPVCVLTVESLLLPREVFIGAPVPTVPGPVALAPTPAPTTAPASGAEAEAPLPEPDTRRSKSRTPPPRPRPPHPPHPRSPPPPHARSPPPPDADVPPPPPFPDILPPDALAPDDYDNGAARRSIACLASLVIASVCIIVFH